MNGSQMYVNTSHMAPIVPIEKLSVGKPVPPSAQLSAPCDERIVRHE